MKKIICVFILIIPFLCSSQTRIRVSGFTNYDAWTHMDPFYLNEPEQDLDNFRPVEYDERLTQLKIVLDSPLMQYWIGAFGSKIYFLRKWGNRKHTNDGDQYFEYSWPMAPYQTKSDYISYGAELYYGFPMSNVKPYVGMGAEFKIEEISSNFIYLDNDDDASSNPYISIPIDQHNERRFNYYAVIGFDYFVGRYFYVASYLRLYFNEIQIDEKMIIRDQTDDAQFRPGIELGFIF